MQNKNIASLTLFQNFNFYKQSLVRHEQQYKFFLDTFFEAAASRNFEVVQIQSFIDNLTASKIRSSDGEALVLRNVIKCYELKLNIARLV